MNRVPSYGPLDAPIAWIGESPGEEECVRGQPFVGPTGDHVRRGLSALGIDPEREVWWSNTCEQRVYPWPTTTYAHSKLLNEWFDVLDQQLRQLTSCKVVVACGGVALERLTGYSDISSWWGSVLRRDDLPTHLSFTNGQDHELYLPPGAIVIPCWHPAGMLRDPSRRATPELLRTYTKVAKYVRVGMLNTYPHALSVCPSLEQLTRARDGATHVAIDTEYGRDTHEVYWVGLTFNGQQIFGLPWRHPYDEYVRDVCADATLTKVGQNIITDIRHLGCTFNGDLYDTMLGHYCLFPRLEVGLDHLARFYLEDVKYWKDMEHTDPRYNALDVLYTWHVWQQQLNECKRRPVDPTPELDARFKIIPVVQRMEDDGMHVDVHKLNEFVQTLTIDAEEASKIINNEVGQYWQVRIDEARARLDDATMAVAENELLFANQCTKHPSGKVLQRDDPLRIKCPECQVAWHRLGSSRTIYKRERARKARAAKELKDLSQGFNWQSGAHLGWLLYEQFKVPGGKRTATGKWRTDKNTIGDLLDKVDEAVEFGRQRSKYFITRQGFGVIRKIKETQGLQKSLATFLNVSLIDGRLCWPNLSYKINGTVTGRLAGGQDKTDDDKVESTGMSLMNLPDKWRRIYIAPPHHVFVAADFSNQEGRLAAYISGDKRYQEMFAEEERTGIKVHAQTAALVYGCAPEDAKRHVVRYQGSEITAYDGGKRARHAVTYSNLPVMMLMNNYGMSLDEALRVYNVFKDVHPTLIAYKTSLVQRILGTWQPVMDDRRGTWRASCVQLGTRYQTTPFGWQITWHGMGKVVRDVVDQRRRVALPVEANEVLAFGLGQAPGASIWPLCVRQLHDKGWHVATGQYDSIMLAVPLADVQQAIDDIRAVLTQPWPQLDGLRLPVEVKVGRNWGAWSVDNPEGLREVD